MQPAQNTPKKIVHLVLGLMFLSLGIIGAFLPVLPTTPFVIVAAYFFSKSSPKLEQWLNNHPFFGPNIDAWKKHGVIPVKAKLLACFFMSLSTLTIAIRPGSMAKKAVLIAVIFACAVYIVSRPSRPK